MSKPVPFQNIIAALLDEQKNLPPSYLVHFSYIEPENQRALSAAWPQASLSRKVRLLEALEDLAEVDTLMSFDDLAGALLTDPEGQVRTLALRLLWECPDSKLIPTYIDILTGDEDSEARAAAATGLGLFVYLGELDEIPAETQQTVEARLLEAATSAESILVRRRALEALGTSSRPEVPAMIEAAYHDAEPSWVISALFAMGRSCDLRWEKQVLAMMHNPNEAIRQEAVRAAGGLGLSSARQTLLDILADEENLDTRREFIWALSKIGGEGVRQQLEELAAAEMDEEESDFLEEALDNLTFNEELASFEMFDFDAGEDNEEEE